MAQAAPAFYNLQTGRWLNRDSIEERGGHNLTAFTRNVATTGWDGLGAIFSLGDIPDWVVLNPFYTSPGT